MHGKRLYHLCWGLLQDTSLLLVGSCECWQYSTFKLYFPIRPLVKTTVSSF